MPKTRVVLYQEDAGTVPLLDWSDTLAPKAQDKCIVRIERLQGLGHELRVGLGGINYGILYFFHGRDTAVLCDGLTKERIVPARDIDLAIRRKHTFEKDPESHTCREL